MRLTPLALTALLCCAACHTTAATEAPPETGLHGTLLVIGGGLDNDNRPVYERFIELAARHGEPRVVVVTAATGPQEEEAIDKTEALQTWAPGIDVHVVRRETPTAETVALIDRATALFFTGGDQARITARYRPDDADTPEYLAMRRLLERGGVIAGASAGDAMMGKTMFLDGRSAPALGIVPPGEEQDPPQLGPQLGPGMNFLPWALTDSHFFERDRLGRLVAGLEQTGQRLGLGVGEDACVEVDLATAELIGISVSESLLVDAAGLHREGLARRGLTARVIAQGDRLRFGDELAPASPPQLPSGPTALVPIAEPGQNRQLASWRLFRQASVAGSGARELRLDGWRIVAAPDAGDVVFALLPGTSD